MGVLAGVLVLGSIATSLVQKTELFNIAIILMSFLLIFWHPTSHAKLSQRLAIRVWVVSLMACAFIWAISIFNTPDSELSDYEKPLKYIACTMVAVQLLKLQISTKFVFLGAVLCLILTSIVVSGQNYYRLELGMNAGTAGYQLCILLLIVASYLLFEKNLRVWEYFSASLAIVLGMWLILETQTRGALVVLAAYAVIAAVEKFRELSRSHRFLGSLFIVAVLGSLLIAAGSSSVVKMRVGQAISDLERIERGDLSGSIGQRFALLKVGFYAVKNPTLLGKGENSSENLKNYLTEMEGGEKYKFLLNNLHFHNQYLDQFTKRGVFGFLAYIVFLFGPLIVASPKKRRALYAVVIPSGVGGLIETPFNNSNFITSYLLYTTFILVVQHNKESELVIDQEGRNSA